MNSQFAEQQIFTLVSKITGHQTSDLAADLFLESDLGIDSIKTVELLNSMIQLIPQERQTEFMQVMPMDSLMQLQTLQEMIDIGANWFEGATSTPAVASKDQLDGIDLTEETVDIVDSQYIFLASHWGIATCSICATICIKGELNLEVAQLSWTSLILRHPLLRAYFSIPEDAERLSDYRLQVIKQPQPPAIEVIDLQEHDAQQQESLIQQEVNRRINESWDLEKWPLHQFFILDLGDSVFELGIHHHHVLSDGLSNQMILREFAEIYGALLAGKTPNLSPKTSVDDYRQLVDTMQQWRDDEAETALKTYLNRQGKEKFTWNPKNKKTTANSAQVASLGYVLHQGATAKLLQLSSRLRVSFNALIVGTFLKTIGEFEKISRSPIINIPTGGRIYPDADASDILGCFAQNLALSFPPPETTSDWSGLIAEVQSEIQSALAQNYDKAQTRQIVTMLSQSLKIENKKIPPIALGLLNNSLKTNLYLSNMGQTGIKNQYGSLEILDYRSATSTNVQSIDTLLEIFNDCLYINANYDTQVFSEALIEKLMETFLLRLEELGNIEVQPQPESKSATAVDPVQMASISQVASEICHVNLTEGDWERDLESELGIDSLELIRLVTQLEKEFGRKLERQKLLSCRTLTEIGQVISPTPASEMAKPSNLPTMPFVAIAEQTKKTPDAIAVLGEQDSLTYQELHDLSNQLAHYLRQAGIKPGDLVGIMNNRNPLMWIGVLGVIKAGGAYVPIDPTYPQDRINYMLGHAEIRILLTEAALGKKLSECLAGDSLLEAVVFLDNGADFESQKSIKSFNRRDWSGESTEELTVVNDPDDLMVVLYTSGSTGRPKGVMLNHQGYTNRLDWMQKAFSLASGDRVAQKTSCCFDISIWEIFWPLMFGATVCPIAKEIVSNPWSLAEWLKKTRINVMHFVPSLFGEFVNALDGEEHAFPDLRWLIFSGEALPMPFIQKWLDNQGKTTGLANLYGPTEASIDVSCYLIEHRPGEKGETSIPIGKAIDNVDLLILDPDRKPLPAGEQGELWIGGVQLAKGYLKDPEKTDKAFCPNPFPHIVGDKLYRTGDLVVELPDGNIDYHGRIDHQVKIRGFRIELGEIETVLLSHASVQEAGVVVLDYGSGQKRLVAGVSGSPVPAAEMKEHLARQLTPYMIPHRIEWLEKLPKNHNGKLDRKALLATFETPSKAAETPQTTTATAATQPDRTTTKVVETEADKTLTSLPLGPAQRWLVAYFDAPYQWTGYSRYLYHNPLDLNLFNQALNELVKRHWALRTIFKQETGQWLQQEIIPETSLEAIFYDGSHLSTEDRNTAVHQKIQSIGQQFRIDQWPLIQTLIVKVSDTSYDINTVGHHIIGDLLSSQILFREFWIIYTNLLGNNTNPLNNLSPSPSYADYVQSLIQEEQTGKLDTHLNYWREQFPNPQSAFQVPLDQQEGANLETSANSQFFVLPPDKTKHLLTHSRRHYNASVYSLLLAPLYRLISDWSDRQDVILSHRVHSRNLGNQQQYFNSIGNFATNFPLGLTLATDQSWSRLVEQIKQKWEQVPMNGTTFDWLGEQLPSFMYPDNHLTPVRANYLGNRDIKSSPLFEFMKEDCDRRLSPPEQKRTTLLEFFFSIAGDRLELQIEYSRHFHTESIIQQLGGRYLALLQSLISDVPTPRPNQPAISADLPLSGQMAIVTGDLSGNNQAIAVKLAQQGAKVTLLAEDDQQLKQTIEQIQQSGGEVMAVPTDTTQLDQIDSAIAKIIEQWQD